jgi:hypothetical protein
MYFGVWPGPSVLSILPEYMTLLEDRMSTVRRIRILLSFGVVAVLLMQSAWFFAAMALMAGAMVLTGISGSWRDWLAWIGMLVGFALFAGIRAKMGPAVEDRTLFLYVIQMETLGGIFGVPTIWLQDHFQSGFLDALSTAVYLSFFVVPQVVVVYLWRKRGPFRRYVAASCLLFAVAIVVHFQFPTAPPWMASERGLIPPLDRIIIRVLKAVSPSLTTAGYEAHANDVAAMPSVHLGLTVLAMLALARLDPRTRWTGWAYSLLMLFAITYLGEHYAVDGIVGAALAWGGWKVAGSRREESAPFTGR